MLFRLTNYRPQTHGMLFLKNNLFHAVGRLDDKARAMLERMDRLRVNQPMDVPPSITYKGISITADRISSAEEVTFLERIASDIVHALEIGAGYGRTAEALLLLYPYITHYTIVDLASVLKLSRRYLSKILPAEVYAKINFVAVDDFDEDRLGEVDLVLNINSMQEMSEEVVRAYLSFISRRAQYFYSKNTVGKFVPELCGF